MLGTLMIFVNGSVTMILVPGASALAQEMISIGSVDLADAQRIDASAAND